MARLTAKEKARRAKISAALKAYYQKRRDEAIRRSVAAKKGAETRRQRKATAEAPYHKPVEAPAEPVKVKVGHGAKETIVRPKKRKPRKPSPRRSDVLAEPQKKTEQVPPKPVRPPPPPESFAVDTVHESNDTWKGPWRDQPPTDSQVADAFIEVQRVSEAIVEYLSGERVTDALELAQPVRAWALNPVINSDSTISGEVRFDIPHDIEPTQIAQYLQDALPSSYLDNLWLTPVIVYEPLVSSGDAGFDKLSASPFEPIRGMAELRVFSIKYDERIGVKAVTGIAKAQEIAVKADPNGMFIRPAYVRIKIRWADRPPRSAYELRKMEEERAKKEARRNFVRMQGFEPIN